MLKLATAVQYSFARLFAAVFWRIGADLWCMTEQKGDNDDDGAAAAAAAAGRRAPHDH
jgi:hypothetical protein